MIKIYDIYNVYRSVASRQWVEMLCLSIVDCYENSMKIIGGQKLFARLSIKRGSQTRKDNCFFEGGV